jgi:hypothetical protein
MMLLPVRMAKAEHEGGQGTVPGYADDGRGRALRAGGLRLARVGGDRCATAFVLSWRE